MRLAAVPAAVLLFFIVSLAQAQEPPVCVDATKGEVKGISCTQFFPHTPTPSPSATPSLIPSTSTPTATSTSTAIPATPTPRATSTPAPSPTATVVPVSGTFLIDKPGSYRVSVSNPSGDCVVIRSTHDVTLEVTATNCKRGVVVSGSQDITIRNSTIAGSAGATGCCDTRDAIYAQDVMRFTVQDSVITGGEANIEVVNGAGVTVLNNTLRNPSGPFPRGTQAQVWGGSNVRISGNVMTCADPCKQSDGVNLGIVVGTNEVSNNVIQGSGVESTCNVQVDQRTFNVHVFGNTLYRAKNCLWGVADGTGHVVENNVMSDCYREGYTGGCSYVWLPPWPGYGPDCGDITVRGNTYSEANPAVFWDGGNCRPLNYIAPPTTGSGGLLR